MFQRPESILHIFQWNKDRYARHSHSAFKVTVKQKYTNPTSLSQSNIGFLCWNEGEWVQANNKKQKKKKIIIFSENHSLLLSASIKTKVVKPQCSEIITAIVRQNKGPSHPSSFLQQWSFTDVILKSTPSHPCYNTIPMNYNIDNRNWKYFELKKWHTRAWTSLRCSVCQPAFKNKIGRFKRANNTYQSHFFANFSDS